MKLLVTLVFLLSLTLHASDEVFSEFADSSIMDLPDATVISLEEEPQELEQYTPDISSIQEQEIEVEIEPKIEQEKSVNQNTGFIILKSDDKNESSISTPKQTIEIAPTPRVEIKEEIKPKEQPKQDPIIIVKDIQTEPIPKPKTHDFWELLEITLANSGELVLKRHDIQITRENLKIVKSEYYPNLSLGYASEYYNGYDRTSSASIGGSFYPGYSQYSDSLSLDLNYELYRFGATDLKMKITQKEIQLIKNELELAKEKVSMNLLSNYVQALKSQKLITYKEQIKQIQDRILQKKWRLFEAGQVSKTELSQHRKSLLSLEKEILRYKLNLTEAVKGIQALANMSISPGSKFAMLEPRKSKTKSFEQSAVAKNINLNLAKKLQELELVKKDYMPTLYASSAYRLYGSDDNNFLKAIKNIRKNNWNVGVNFKWNIFNGYKTDATVQKIRYEINKLTEQYQLAKFDFETKNRKRELLKQSLDKILQTETDLLGQTDLQEDMLIRLRHAGQAPSTQLDQIQMSKLQSELDFRLSVIEHARATVSGELIN